MKQEIRHENYALALEDEDLFGKVDLIIADPGYGLGLADWDSDIDFKNILKNFSKLLNKNGSALIFNTELNVDLIIKISEECGLMIQAKMVWVKTNPNPKYWRKSGYTKFDKEWIVWLSKTNHPKFKLPVGMHYHSGIFNYPSQQGRHMNAKPLLLIKELMMMHSTIDDLVMEPFGGSFPVSEIAKELHRNCISYTLDE